LRALAAFAGVAVLMLPMAASAATTTSLSQVINTGTLTYDIVDGGGSPVASPSVAFSSTTFDFACQTETATFGTATEKVQVSNPLLSGVKLDINANTPGTDTWDDGNGHTYAYNDPAGTTAGCTNGQMTISGGSFNQTAGATAPTYTTPGGAFTTTNPVTLLNNTSSTAWEGELTGYTLSQKIPAEQADGTYSLSMTISAISQ
ncbi:hypothetical protein KDA14_00635, partial [Candidatus Saccharibacteria bacterium]|nr:hypothetical protein [Candidatus Saccharibacteria bacterium]